MSYWLSKVLLVLGVVLFSSCVSQNTTNTHKTFSGTKAQAKEKVLLLMTQAGYELEDESENKQVYSAQAGVAKTVLYQLAVAGTGSSKPRKQVTMVFAGKDGNVLVRSYCSLNANGVFGQKHRDDDANADVVAILNKL